MITFDEADKIEITSEEISAFKRLLGNNDFQTFQDFVEKQIMKKAYALATGSFVEGITKEDYLNELRGLGEKKE